MCVYATFCLFIHLLMDIWVASIFWLFWLRLQWTLSYKYLFESLSNSFWRTAKLLKICVLKVFLNTLKIYVTKNMYKNVHSVLIYNVTDRKYPKFSAGEWFLKLCYIYTIECYSAMRMNEYIAGVCVDTNKPQKHHVEKQCQMQKSSFCINWFMWIQAQANLISGEIKCLVVEGRFSEKEYRETFWEMKMFYILNVVVYKEDIFGSVVLLSSRSALFILCIILFSDTSFANIKSFSVNCIITLLMMSFDA